MREQHEPIADERLAEIRARMPDVVNALGVMFEQEQEIQRLRAALVEQQQRREEAEAGAADGACGGGGSSRVLGQRGLYGT